MNRLEQAQEHYRQHASLLACPLCRNTMTVEGGALRCQQGHSFDFARSGYVNLHTGRPNEDYSAALFAARSAVAQAGFFDGMLDALADMLKVHMPHTETVMDAGCGEGSHLLALLERLQQKGLQALGAGVDLSKPGIGRAARRGGALWAVADLARLPFSDGSFDAIVNILSPARYDEFTRVLKPSGIVLKVVPGRGYLKELREALGAEDYDNTDVLSLFSRHTAMAEQRRVSSAMEFRGEALDHLMAMTPLVWHADPEKLRAVKVQGRLQVTAEFLLLAGSAKA